MNVSSWNEIDNYGLESPVQDAWVLVMWTKTRRKHMKVQTQNKIWVRKYRPEWMTILERSSSWMTNGYLQEEDYVPGRMMLHFMIKIVVRHNQTVVETSLDKNVAVFKVFIFSPILNSSSELRTSCCFLGSSLVVPTFFACGVTPPTNALLETHISA